MVPLLLLFIFFNLLFCRNFLHTSILLGCKVFFLEFFTCFSCLNEILLLGVAKSCTSVVLSWIYDHKTFLMIWTTLINNHSKKTCVKLKKPTLVAREVNCCRNFQQNKSLRKMNSMRRGRIEKGEEIFEVLSPLLSSYWLYKEKRKVKIIFLTLGRNDQIIPLVLPTIHTSPKAF